MGPDQLLLACSAGHDLVVLGAAFLVCAVLARGGRRVGLPTIPLFMAAGIALGPNTPGPVLFENPDELTLLAAFGLVFLLFTLGLEFSFDDLTSGGTRLLGTAGAYLALNIGAGLALGFALGWGTPEALVIAGATGISSSAIVTKVLVELGRLGNPETRLILGIIVIEDLFLALYLAALAPVLGQADGLAESLLLFGRSFAFLAVLGLVARFGGPVVEKLIRSRDDELLTISFFGFAVLLAGLAEVIGVSDAIGAFMAGLILAGTALARRIERLAIPIRDAFAAVFFFTFGLQIRPGDLIELAGPVAVAVVLTMTLALGRRHPGGPGQPARPPGRGQHRHDRDGPRRVRADPRGPRRERPARRPARAVRRRLRARARRAQPAPGCPVAPRRGGDPAPTRTRVGAGDGRPRTLRGGPDRGARHDPDRVGRPRGGRLGSRAPGDWLRWLERCLHTAEVTGSSPVSPTPDVPADQPSLPRGGCSVSRPRASGSRAAGQVVESVQRRPHLTPRAAELAGDLLELGPLAHEPLGLGQQPPDLIGRKLRRHAEALAHGGDVTGGEASRHLSTVSNVCSLVEWSNPSPAGGARPASRRSRARPSCTRGTRSPPG